MTDLYPATALATGLLGLAAGVAVPRLIAWLPEPEPEPDDAEQPEEAEEAEETGEPEEPKELYADIAASPGLLWRAVLGSGISAAVVGLVSGWTMTLLVLLPLVPVGVALAVIDWRTRLLPTRLIAPAYAVTVAAVLIAWLVDGREVGDLERTALGWLIYGGSFFVLWFVYPRGLGYGDVRLSGVLGLALGWTGWAQLLLGIWSGLVLGGVLGALLAAVIRRRDNPFGPFMLVGALVGLAVGEVLLPGLAG